ncbi:hypothetical protein QFC21_006063 [Naganishia friedmannii]|uniref:Uncharacterized protein n=1 Tax=Naganishia friedmannii TaxID=89922 RepID=A0ACC2V4R1_9TREE|nr:hypothetical protein QFC21_006063 [Naganishia friedmannii]
MSSSSSDHAESSDSDSSTLSNDTDDGQEAAKPSAEGLRNELHLAKQLWDDKLDQLLSRIDGFEQLGRRLDRIERRTKRTANLSDSPEPNAWLSKNTRIMLSPPSNDSSNNSDSSYEEDSSAATSNDDYTDGPSASDGEEGTGDELDLPEEDPALLALNHVKQTFYELVDRVGTRKRQRRGKVDVPLDKLRDDIVRCGQKINKQKAKRIQELEKENTRMKEAIKKVVSDRSELAGDLYGDPIVPLDIMSVVGQFLSGDNAYASLAKYSLTCRALREELQPMIYETVILHEDDPDRNKVFSSGSSLRPAFTHVK